MRCARCGFDPTDLWEVLSVAIPLLQREGRVTYRALSRKLGCDDALLDDVCEELLFKRLAVDEEGKGLVWVGGLLSQETNGSSTPDSPELAAIASSDNNSPAPAQSADLPAAQPADQLAEESDGQTEPVPILCQELPLIPIGRDVEISLLQLRWEQSKEGFGQIVLLSGEAGMGKARLVDTLAAQGKQEGAARLSFRCSPYHLNTAFYPLVAHWQRVVGWQPEAPPAGQIEALEKYVQACGLPLEKTVPLFARLLSIPVSDDRYPPLALAPEQQRQQLRDSLLAWLAAEAAQRPVLTSWEELQWADPSTVELLALVIEQAPTVRMLNVLTFQPEFVPPWPSGSHLTPMTLDRLDSPQLEALVRQLVGGGELPAEVMTAVERTTDGLPLIVEELMKLWLESGGVICVDGHYELSAAGQLALPANAQDTLRARLDRLSNARKLMQAAAICGQEFAYTDICALVGEEEAVLHQQLDQLVSAGVVVQAGQPPQARYCFAQRLMRDVVYTSMPAQVRRKTHQLIAQFYEQESPQLVRIQPELLAYHYTEAGRPEQSLPYWKAAAWQALEQAAYTEALSHVQKGLEIVQTLPDSLQRLQHEFALQASLAVTLTGTKGVAAPEVATASARARELSKHIGHTPDISPIVFRLHQYYTFQADYRVAREIADEYVGFADAIGEPTVGLVAHGSLGASSLWLGEYATALENLEHTLALYNPHKHRRLSSVYGEDPKAANGLFAAWTLWYLGYPDQALRIGEEAVRLGQDLAYPVDVGWTLVRSAWLHHHRREVSHVQERVAAGIAITTEHGLPFPLAVGTVLQGWALVQQDHTQDGIGQIKHGIAVAQETGAGWGQAYFLALLAEAHGKAGDSEKGLDVLVEALGIVRKTDERFCEAEIYRIRGELLLARDRRSRFGPAAAAVEKPASEAEDCLLLAIKIARRQSAKSWELRASLSLSRAWQQQGKREQARDLLEPIYSWFTEGFDTEDVQEAKALLATLSEQ